MIRLAVIAALILLGSACSRTELAYRNADWLLEYYARQTVDVSAAQREDWRPVLVGTLQHHRENELPLIIAYLDLAGRTISQTDGPVSTACLIEGVLLLSQQHARLAVDLAVPLLADLDDAQISHLREYTTQRQEKAIKVYLNPDPQRRKKARQQRFMDRIEAWTGKLNDDQRQLVDDALERIPDLSAPWLTYREQQTDRLLQLLETHTSATALREYLNAWWVEQRGRSAGYRQQWRIAKHEFVIFMDALGDTLTDRQRASLLKRLGDLGKDLAPFLSPAYTRANLPEAVPMCASASVSMRPVQNAYVR